MRKLIFANILVIIIYIDFSHCEPNSLITLQNFITAGEIRAVQ